MGVKQGIKGYNMKEKNGNASFVGIFASLPDGWEKKEPNRVGFYIKTQKTTNLRFTVPKRRTRYKRENYHLHEGIKNFLVQSNEP